MRLELQLQLGGNFDEKSWAIASLVLKNSFVVFWILYKIDGVSFQEKTKINEKLL